MATYADASTYADWDSPDYSLGVRLTRLSQYIIALRRISDQPDMASAGNSISRGALLQRLAHLEETKRQLEATVGSNRSPFTQGRPV